MKLFWGITIAIAYLFGPIKDRLDIPKKGKCPFKDGVMKKLTDHDFVVGTGESTVDIWGKDTIVLSATDGWVKDVIQFQDAKFMYIRIRIDTTIYCYGDIDRPLVQEGQRVVSGQPIAIAQKNRIEFYVSNYLDKIYRNPDSYVDCICELPNALIALAK